MCRFYGLCPTPIAGWRQRGNQNQGEGAGFGPDYHGEGDDFQHLGPYLIETFIESMVIALICISVLLLLVFRSLWMGLLALFTNCIPLFGGAAFLYDRSGR